MREVIKMFQPKRYSFEVAGALLLYSILLFGAASLERKVHPAGVLNLAINLIPMLGAIAAAWAVLRGLWRMDEMQRRIQFDAIAMAFLGTALITFGWGFAEGAGVPHLRAFYVWPMMGALWVVGLIIARWRYS